MLSEEQETLNKMPPFLKCFIQFFLLNTGQEARGSALSVLCCVDELLKYNGNSESSPSLMSMCGLISKHPERMILAKKDYITSYTFWSSVEVQHHSVQVFCVLARHQGQKAG